MSSIVLMRLVIGFAGASMLALAARHFKMLTPAGAFAAAIIGTIVFGFGGWSAAVLLLLFFVSSSLLTRLRAEHKSHPEHKRGRSAGQVLANGAIASVLAIWYGLDHSSAALLGFAGAIAASTADTWATEVGLLSSVRPRLITTWKDVPAGSSGGITWLGTAAGIAGAATISFAAFYSLKTSVAAVLAAGVIAMLVDSLLGATIEGRVALIDNNAVNFAATIVGAVLSVLLA